MRFVVELERVIDGDTVEVVVDHGLGVSSRQRVRVVGIDAAELRGPARWLGQEHRRQLKRWVGECRHFVLVTEGRDLYGRVLGDLLRLDDEASARAWMLSVEGVVATSGSVRREGWSGTDARA